MADLRQPQEHERQAPGLNHKLSTVLNQLVVSRTNGTNLCLLLASLPTVPHCLTSIHTAMQALGITLEREPLALRSTRNHRRTAMRRGAAWSAGRLSSFLAVRRGRLALAGGPAAEPSWLQSPRRCPQEHGWASQRAAAGRSSPGGADAGRAFVVWFVSSCVVRVAAGTRRWGRRGRARRRSPGPPGGFRWAGRWAGLSRRSRPCWPGK